MCCLQETHFRSKDTHRQKVKEWRRYAMQRKSKESRVIILILDKVDFKTDCNKRQSMMLHNNKWWGKKKDVNICKYLCTQYRSIKYIKQILIELK